MWSNHFWANVCLVSVIRSTPNNKPLKYRRPIKISNWIRHVYIMVIEYRMYSTIETCVGHYLWALITPQTIMVVGLYRKLFDPVRNCVSLKPSCLKIEVDFKLGGQREDSPSLQVITYALKQIVHSLLSLEWCLCFEHIVQSYWNTCLFVVRS